MSSTEVEQAAPAELSALRHAFELARRGPANGPNPRVGAVLLSPEGRGARRGLAPGRWHAAR